MGMLIAAPAALAGSGGHTIMAPYTTVTAKLTNPSTVSGGGSGSHSHRTFWNNTTGIAGFSAKASTTWWTNATNSSANEYGQVVLSLPIHVKSTGAHTITVLWVTTASGYANLTAGKCTAGATSIYSGCTRSADVFVYGSAYLLDKTTNTHIASTNKWAGNHTYLSNYTNCAYSTCRSTTMGSSFGVLHTGASYWAFYFNGTAFNATHHYALKMTIYGGARVILMTSMGATLSGASANAQFNSATLGNGEDLYSISVS
jgi:hypothetical protein